MSAPSYEAMVATLAKPGEKILETMTPKQADLLHMAVGISGEAGELLDAIKKHVIYNKALDLTNVIEELGDLEFYMEHLRQLLGVDREYVLDANQYKLMKRYEGGKYSDKAAQNRADKKQKEWIEWPGGDCPVSKDTLIMAKLRNGVTDNKPFPAHLYNWSHDPVSPQVHIVAYCIIEL